MQEPEEVWNGIIDRASSQGIEKLSPHERTIYFVNWYLTDYEGGGLSGFLYNVSPVQDVHSSWVELRSVADAVEEVGGSISTEILRDVAQHVERVDVGETSTWEEFWNAVVPEGLLETAELRLDAEVPVLWEMLEQFTRRHFA